MKKIFTFILSLVMLLSMSTVAFAEGETGTITNGGKSSIDLGKIYELENAGTINPEETFNFTISKDSVSDSQYTKDNMPMVSMIKDKIETRNEITCEIKIDSGKATLEGYKNTATIYLPTYTDVGVFTYKIVENSGSTLGVNYDTNPIYLRVTAFRGEDDTINRAVTYFVKKQVDGKEVIEKLENGNITNTYYAGNLSINKTVTGNMGEKERPFTVKVTLNAPFDKNVVSTIKASGGSDTRNKQNITFVKSSDTQTNKAEATFYLKDNETVTIENIPYDVTYTVVEDDYTTVANGKYDYPFYNDNEDTENKGITDSIHTSSETVGIRNNKGRDVNMGILVDNLPYIIILAGVVVGMGVFFVKKRTANDN